MVKKIILISLVGSLSACTSYQTTQYPCPPRPALQPITEDELNDMGDDTYAKLVMREEALKGYARLLEVHCE